MLTTLYNSYQRDLRMSNRPITVQVKEQVRRWSQNNCVQPIWMICSIFEDQSYAIRCTKETKPSLLGSCLNAWLASDCDWYWDRGQVKSRSAAAWRPSTHLSRSVLQYHLFQKPSSCKILFTEQCSLKSGLASETNEPLKHDI